MLLLQDNSKIHYFYSWEYILNFVIIHGKYMYFFLDRALQLRLSGSRKHRETNKIERKSLCFRRERGGDFLFLKNKRVKSS